MADAGVTIQWTSDHEKLIQGIAKTNAKLERTVANLRKVNREGKGASKGVKGIGEAAFAAGAGFVSMHAAIAKVNQALQEQKQLRMGAASRIEEEERALKQLIQISRTPEEMAAHLRTADRVREAGPGLRQGEAYYLTFLGKSLGFTPEQVVYMASFKKLAIDIIPLFEGIAGIGAAFGKGTLGGTPRTKMNAFLAAAELSRVDVEDIARETLTAAQPVKKLGGTGAEALAGISVAAIALKSVEGAATAVARLSDLLKADPRFKGIGLAASLEKLTGMDERQLERLLGKNIRAERGAGVLLGKEQLELFRTTLAEIKRSAAAPVGTGRVAIGIGIAETTTPLKELMGMQAARERRKAVEQEVLGPDELQRQRIREIINEINVERSFLLRWRNRTERWLLDPLAMTPTDYARELSTQVFPDDRDEYRDRIREMGIELDHTTAKLKELSGAVDAVRLNQEVGAD